MHETTSTTRVIATLSCAASTPVSGDEWLKQRRGRITSTVHGIVSSRNREATAKRILSPRDIFYLPFVAKGIADEQKGVDYLRSTLEEERKTVELREVGLVFHPQHNW